MQHKHPAAQENHEKGGSYVLPYFPFLPYFYTSWAFEWHIRVCKKKSFPTVCGKPWLLPVTPPFTISGRWRWWGAVQRQRSSSMVAAQQQRGGRGQWGSSAAAVAAAARWWLWQLGGGVALAAAAGWCVTL
jgi:hypothetical protein